MHPGHSETLFISDLHLDPSRVEITQLFLHFLAHTAPGADSLYILGDLFEVWLGDDDLSEYNLQVIQGLRQLTQQGTRVFLMHGNRDFLMGESFTSMSGSLLLHDPTTIDLYGVPTLLMHGDLLCTDDHKYMEFRSRVRTREWQHEFLARPLQERDHIVRGLRQESKDETAQKDLHIMDVNQDTVMSFMRKYDVTQLIHGHTHRPGIHRFTMQDKTVTRTVLGDWHTHGSILRCNAQSCQLQDYSA